ncbi:MAG TPA: septal ring lytic transglycosylase RlpA family protein [Saprospiraceae bacterium]|nr:septal ring lytic transglycosylase RlpA family protein [Saprospiraceae bacterium]HPG06515.1 septal ring lytic transglycosylase RlpA family protein [Saprospiraceae bacterium]HPQ99809.1 septal ring lytic transglycosylase RlpA family protein [Saprospiraceae bacterium]HRV83958.1 septal ring lytic transglycosylase RlpA family protein [Saprospiraceae bacterium]
MQQSFRAILLLAMISFALPKLQKKVEIPFNYEEAGKASYYSDALEGNLTASGEVFSQNELTAAHRTLPLGTKVLVFRPKTGQSVWVTINDRGPYVNSRIIDLSKKAAEALGMVHKGVGQVVIKAYLEPVQP